MQEPSAYAVLLAWEQGRTRHALDRGLVLYALAAPDLDLEALADHPLGQRNAALLGLRRALFGDALVACVDCPACREKLEFSVSASALLTQAGPSHAQVEVEGLAFRVPTTRDLAGVARDLDAGRAARTLLRGLLATPTDLNEQTALALVPKVAAALEVADPCLDFVLEQHCPACGHHWPAPFDVASFVWDELETRARRLLDEVHVLARAYGWAEQEILSLTDARRSAYLERVLA